MPFLDSESKTTAAHQKHSSEKCFPSDFSFWVIHEFLSTGKAWVCLKYTVQNLFLDFHVSCSSVPCRIEAFLRETETYRAPRWLYIIFWFALLLINEVPTWPDVRFLKPTCSTKSHLPLFFPLLVLREGRDHCLAHAFSASLELSQMWIRSQNDLR